MESAVTNNLENPSENVPEQSPKPIAEFVARPDFPQCALNQLVDIGGYAGVVVEIAGNSLRVRSPEQSTKGFNFHTLKKLYAPRLEAPPMPVKAAEPSAPAPRPAKKQEEKAPEKVEPKRNIIADPNFAAPVQQLNEFISLADFPQCTFGKHLEINGYTGVVVEIINGSLKIRSQEEVTRSYNANVLKKLYGKA
ncbi:MAG: hypothetical protein JWM68_499 [Verrucomicrobiales bacterium]|nr:hypothetical protein [Verrucomicrobiales bacterium]